MQRGADEMQVQTMQGYFNDGVFYQHGQQVKLPERQLVIVNVLDIPFDSNVLSCVRWRHDIHARHKHNIVPSAW